MKPFFLISVLLQLTLSSLDLQAQQTEHSIKYDQGIFQVRLKNAGLLSNVKLQSEIPYTEAAPSIIKMNTKGQLRQEQKMKYFTHPFTITNIFTPTSYGIKWEVQILANDDGAWTLPLTFSMQVPNAKEMLFWTTWPDQYAMQEREDWNDPFEAAPFQNLDLYYGGKNHYTRDGFSVPIATTLDRKSNKGLSFIESLSDTIFNLKLKTTKQGIIRYEHRNNRINSKHPIHFTFHLVLHEADWRPALDWTSKHFPQYFYPTNTKANDVGGGGAYSAYEGSFDAEQIRKMGLSFNWKASFDFPYMGMFIPPVKSETETWNKFTVDGSVQTTSLQSMNSFISNMNKAGFYTLSYFNVNEFGNRIVYPYQEKTILDEDIWKDGNSFLYKKMKSGIFIPAGQHPYWYEQPLFSNWEGCVVMDPGDSTYQEFLITQASRHVALMPGSAGICVDRLDWSRYFSNTGDDGVSMVDIYPARSLLLSWNSVMNRVAPIMHNAGKVIFANVLNRRIDLLKHIDGIYDEYGNYPYSINYSSYMGIKKPLVMWTTSTADFKPDPDAYFQRHLYVGAFMTIPFPGNDHTIQMDGKVEDIYIEYAPLFQAFKGREWVLNAHVIASKDAKVNLFKVGNRLIAPIVHSKKESATITLNLGTTEWKGKKVTIKYLQPGSQNWIFLAEEQLTESTTLKVPLKKGCAMVSIE